MHVAKLSADFNYRSLHLPEVMAGNDSAGIDYEVFARVEPVGNDWVAREVIYVDEMRQARTECCDAGLTPSERVDLSEAKKPVGDFPHFWGINFGVLTERSFEVLHDLISPYVEFLPLTSTHGHFTAFKVLRFVDALDRQQSNIEWQPQLNKDVGKPRIARQIKKFVFHDNCLSQEVIFQLPEMPLSTEIFVTERFMRAVEQHHLMGFQFQQVWPSLDDREKFMRKRLKRLK